MFHQLWGLWRRCNRTAACFGKRSSGMVSVESFEEENFKSLP